MRIDEEGTMELSAEENQRLMDQLEIAPQDYEDPPVEIECILMDDQAATFTALNTDTGKTIELVFDLMAD